MTAFRSPGKDLRFPWGEGVFWLFLFAFCSVLLSAGWGHADARFAKPKTIMSRQFDGLDALSAADLDGDGDVDVLCGTGWGHLYWSENLRSDGSTWRTHDLAHVSGKISALVVADLDGDGKPDVLAVTPEDPEVYGFRNPGTRGEWTRLPVGDAGEGETAAAVADLDGDGDPDVLAAAEGGKALLWYENTGAGSPYRVHPIHTFASTVESLAVGDLDGDGDMDTAVGLSSSDRVVWLADLDGKGTSWRLHPVDSADVAGPRSLSAADLDGDGDLDLVVAMYRGDRILWYENRGGRGIRWKPHVVASGAESSGPSSILVVDLDNDGDEDILAADWLGDDVRWYENRDGRGSDWAAKLLFDGGAQGASGVCAADLDGDKDLDVLSVHAWTWAFSPLYWFRNRTPHADLVLQVLSPSHAPIAGGPDPVEYAFEIRNNGPAPAVGAVLKGWVAADVAKARWRPDGKTEWLSWKGVVDLGTIPPGGKRKIRFQGWVRSSAPKVLKSRFRLFAAETYDPDMSGNRAVLRTPVRYVANLGVSQTARTDPVVAGERIRYELKVSNGGPSDAVNVVLEEPLTSEFRNPEVRVGNAGPWKEWTGTLNLDRLPAGEAVRVWLRSRVASSARGVVVSEARVKSDAEDPETRNNTSGRVRVKVVSKVDLSVEVQALTTPLVPGETAVFEVDVQNKGPSDARAVALALETVPELRSPRVSLDEGKKWREVSGKLVLDLIRAGGRRKVLLRGKVPPSAGGVLAAAAEVSCPGRGAGKGKNRLVKKVPLERRADVSLALSRWPTSGVAGKDFSCLLVAANAGPSDVPHLLLELHLDPRLVVGGVSLDGGRTWVPAKTTVPVGPLAAGETKAIRIRGKISGSASGEVRGGIALRTGIPDSRPADNEVRCSMVLRSRADLSVEQQVQPEAVIAGMQITYQIRVRNGGPSDAPGVRVETRLPKGIRNLRVSRDGGKTWKRWKGSLRLGTLKGGETREFRIQGDVASSLKGPLSESVRVKSRAEDPDTRNNVAKHTVRNVISVADLSLSVQGTPDPAVAGGVVTYTLEVQNSGPSDARKVTVMDDLPPQISGAEFSLDGGATWRPWMEAGVLGTVPSGASKRLLLRGTIDPQSTGVLVNTARVKSETSDPEEKNNVARIRSSALRRVADLEIRMSVSPDPLVAGRQLTYTFTVRNNGPSRASGVVVRDDLPSSILRPKFSIDGGATWGDWKGSVNLGAINGRGTRQVLILGRLSPAARGVLVNRAGVEAATPDSNPRNNRSPALRTEVKARGDLSVQIKPSLARAVAGSSVTYTVTLANKGPSDARDLTLKIALSSSLERPRWRWGDSGKWEPWKGSLVVRKLKAEEKRVLRIQGKVASSADAPLLANVRIQSRTEDPNPVDNLTRVRVEVERKADLSLAGSGVPAAVEAGRSLKIRIQVRNEGPSDAEGVVWKQGSVSGMEGLEFSKDAGASWLPWKGVVKLGRIRAGNAVPLLVRGYVPASARGTLSLAMRVRSGTVRDPATKNNVLALVVPVRRSSNLSLGFRNLPKRVIAGKRVRYRLRIANAGPSDAEQVTLSGNPGGELLKYEYSLDRGKTWKPWSSPLKWKRISAKGFREVRLRCWLPPSWEESLKVGSFRVASSSADPDPSDNTTRPRRVPVYLQADLALEIDAPPSGTAGKAVAFTVRMRNKGPSDAPDVSLTGILPEEMKRIRFSLDQGGTWNPWKGSVKFKTLKRGAARRIRFLVRVPSSASGVWTYSFQVRARCEDPTSDDRVAAWRLQVARKADLFIRIRPLTEEAVAGRPLAFQLTLGNNGPSDAADVVLRSSPPSSLVHPQRIAGKGEAREWKEVWKWGAIPAGTRVAARLQGTVSPDATGAVAVQVRIDSAVPDPKPENNGDERRVLLGVRADLSASCRVCPARLRAGSVAKYVMVLENAGPSDARDVTVEMRLPPLLHNVRVRFGGESSWRAGQTSYRLSGLKAGTSLPVEIQGRVPPSASGILETVVALRSSRGRDPDTSNNTVGPIRTEVYTESDLNIQVKEIPRSVVAGREAVCVLEVTNAGPSDAHGVVLSSTRFPRIEKPELVPGEGRGKPRPWKGRIVLGDLAAGTSRSFRIRGRVPPSMQKRLAYSFEVTSGSRDPESSNNRTGPLEVVVEPRADLSVSMVGSPDPVSVTRRAEYRIVVQNRGPSDARKVMLVDRTPAVLLNPEAALGDSDSWIPWKGVSVLGTFPPGKAETIRIRGTVSPSASGKLRNKAEVQSDTQDPRSGDNRVEAVLRVETLADLSVRLVAVPASLRAGGAAIYTVAVSNAGPSRAKHVELAVSSSPSLRNVESSVNGGRTWERIGSSGRTNLDLLPPGSTRHVLIRGRVAPGAVAEIRTDLSVSSATRDPDVSNNRLKNTVSVIREADLAVSVSGPSSVSAGDPITYTLTVENEGPADAEKVVLHQRLPSQVTHAEVSTDGGASWESFKENLFLGTIPPGTSKLVLTKGVVNPVAASGSMVSEAAVQADTADPDTSNNRARTVPVAIRGEAVPNL